MERPRGRPARTDDPQRLVVRIPADLKRWLAHYAIDNDTDMAQLTAQALEMFRKKVGGDRGRR